MSVLSRMLLQKKLSLNVQLCIYQTCILNAVVVFFSEAGLWFSGAIINGHYFQLKFVIGSQNYRRWRPAALTAPSRTLLTIRPKPAWQDAILLRRILPIVLYESEAWTFPSTETKRLQAFHMQCQRCILGVVWSDRVRNTMVAETTGLPDVSKL